MPVFQRSTIKVLKPKNLDDEYFDLIITTTQFKPTEPKETVLNRADIHYKFNGLRWDRR